MSDFDVYGDEMPSVPPIDESAVEALLAGRTNGAATGDMGLTAFVEDLRTAADGPVPQPTPQLAAFMAEGLSTEKGEVPATAASTATGPASRATGRPKRRTRRMTVAELLAALGAKLAGMGMAAKAALGLGLATVTTTAAGAAGVLPNPAQHAVASVVNAVSPLDIPDGRSTAGVAAEDDDPTAATSTTTTTTTSVAGGGDEDDGTDDGETGVPANHGACVSAAAHSANRGPGGEHGKAVSEVAKSDCGKSGGDDDGDDDGTTTTSSPTTTAPEGDDDADVSANRGPGNGNGGNGGSSGNRGSGSGGGDSGSGNSGSGKNN